MKDLPQRTEKFQASDRTKAFGKPDKGAASPKLVSAMPTLVNRRPGHCVYGSLHQDLAIIADSVGQVGTYVLFAALKAWFDRRRALADLRGLDKPQIEMSRGYLEEETGRARDALASGDRRNALLIWLQTLRPFLHRVLASKAAVDLMFDLCSREEIEKIVADGLQHHPSYGYFAVAHAELARRRGDFNESLRRCGILRRKFAGMGEGYSIAAACLLDLGRTPEAETLIERGIRSLPYDFDLLVEHARYAMRRQDWHEAFHRWERIRTCFDQPAVRLNVAECLRMLGRYDEAELIADEISKNSPGNTHAHLELASIASARGNLEAAMKHWATVRKGSPLLALGYTAGADTARLMGCPNDADAILCDAVNTISSDLNLHLEYARNAHGRKDWREELDRWTLVHDRFPDCDESREGQKHAIAAFRMMKQGDEAVSALVPPPIKNQNVVETEESHLANNRSDVMLLINQRRWDDALRLLEDLESAGADVTEERALWIVALRESGRLDEATKKSKEFLLALPDYPRLWIEAALISFVRRDWALSRQEFAEIRARFPEEPDAYLRGAEAAREMGAQQEAEALLADAVERFPARKDIALYFASYASDVGDWQSAADRWTIFRYRFPDTFQGYTAGYEAFARAGQLELARCTLGEAVNRFPTEREVLVTHAREATERLAWQEASERWALANQAYPEDKEIVAGAAQVMWHMQLAHVDDQYLNASSPCASASSLGSSVPNEDAELLMRFEGLGDNCEFGLVQRNFGAEPISLYRWSGVQVDHLIQALDENFVGVGDPQFTEMACRPGDEYVLSDTRQFLTMHTFIKEGQRDFESLFRSQCRRLTYLRDRLVHDLLDPFKIFVYKPRDGNFQDEQIRRLFEAIARFGNATLLCVRLTQGARPNGFVETWHKNLFVGYIDRLSLEARNEEIDFEGWISICRRAVYLSGNH